MSPIFNRLANAKTLTKVATTLSGTANMIPAKIEAISKANGKPNQDFFAYGKAASSKDHKAVLARLFEGLSLSLVDNKKFERSGATCTVAIVDGKNVAIASLGDSPAFLILKNKVGKNISLKSTQEHSFTDPDIAKYFETKLDGVGKPRLQGLSVPCFGHNFDDRISKIPPRIRLFNLETIAAANYLDLEKLHVVVASDGLLEMDSSTIGFDALATDVVVLDGENGRLKFERKTKGNINEAKEDDMAHSLAEGAILNGSRDNVTVVTASFEKSDAENAEATVVIVADGNGINGAEAAKQIVMDACTMLEVDKPRFPESDKKLDTQPSTSPTHSKIDHNSVERTLGIEK